MILIIGSEEEYHSSFVYNNLIARGENVCYLDTRKIGVDFLCSFYPSDKKLNGSITLNNQKIFLKDIKSVYWRYSYGVSVHPDSNSMEDINTAYMQERELSSILDSLYRSLDCLWVNSPNAINMHKAKAYQLALMAKENIRVPCTLITNDRDELENFVNQYSKDLIFKPVLGGAHTEKFDPKLLKDKRMELLKNSPVQFQELIEGFDIRVYGIEDKLFAAKIIAKTIDFRDDQSAKLIPIDLPTIIKQDCLKIMELLDLNFTGIDIKYNPKNEEYVFIEANPSPMFTFFQEKTGYPISDTLIDLLIKGK